MVMVIAALEPFGHPSPVWDFIGVEKKDRIDLLIQKMIPDEPGKAMPKMSRVHIFPYPFGDQLFNERIFDEETLGESFVNLFQKGSILGSAIKKMVADRHNELG